MSPDPATGDGDVARLIARDAVVLAARAEDKWAAVRLTGRVLVDSGAVAEGYVEAMVEREQTISTYVGEGVSIPHATLAGKESVLRDALAVVRFPDGVDWDGERVTLCIGIAAKGDGHIAILAELAQILLDPERAAGLRAAESVDEVLTLLTPADEADDHTTHETSTHEGVS
ncbi:MAG TPA: PTS sugar transporter subunit IIA [Cellulomonas sp.]